jgi:hypothetical protein
VPPALGPFLIWGFKRKAGAGDVWYAGANDGQKRRHVLKSQLDMLEHGEFGVRDQLPDAAATEHTNRRLQSVVEELDRLINYPSRVLRPAGALS